MPSLKKELLAHMKKSTFFTTLSSNNTYTFCMINDIGDCEVFCRPGGERGFITVSFEHRKKGTLKCTLVLVPPCKGTAHHQRRTKALNLIRADKRPNSQATYVTLISFSSLVSGFAIPKALQMIQEEIMHLKKMGSPSHLWKRQINIVSDWRLLFGLLNQKAVSQGSSVQSSVPKEQPKRKESSLGKAQINCNRILFFGAEFNASKGDHRSMDEMTHEALRGGLRANETYFKLIKAQLRSLEIQNQSLYFDDVSIVPGGGKHSEESVYRENVRLSVWFHRRLLSSYRPDLVVIGGGQAMKEYVGQVLESKKESAPYVLQVRNPSQGGHRGAIDEGWIKAYGQKNVRKMLESSIRENPQDRFFRLVIPKMNGEWRIETF